MMTYITKDDTKIDKSSFIHFVLSEVHYVACFDVSSLDGIQRIPWDLFYLKMSNTTAQWIDPDSASIARRSFENNKEEFLSMLKTPRDDDSSKKTDQLIIRKHSRSKSLIELEQKRQRRKAYSW